MKSPAIIIIFILVSGCISNLQQEHPNHGPDSEVEPKANLTKELGGDDISWVATGRTLFQFVVPNNTRGLAWGWISKNDQGIPGNPTVLTIDSEVCPRKEAVGGRGASVAYRWCDHPAAGRYNATIEMKGGALIGRVCVMTLPEIASHLGRCGWNSSSSHRALGIGDSVIQ